MKLLIDANILLDVLQNRENFVRASSMVWKLCETEQAKGYISALTFANLVYIMRKEMDAQRIEEVLHMLSLIFEFAELNDSDLFRAAALQWPDFEDAVQSVTAERIHADYIIKRNVRDFSRSKVIAFTPDELLARL
jgi:predicted nucleic acid-binding protein